MQAPMLLARSRARPTANASLRFMLDTVLLLSARS